MLKVGADCRKNGRLRKYHYSKIQNAGDCVARTGVREIGFKFGSLPHDPGGITCMAAGPFIMAFHKPGGPSEASQCLHIVRRDDRRSRKELQLFSGLKSRFTYKPHPP